MFIYFGFIYVVCIILYHNNNIYEHHILVEKRKLVIVYADINLYNYSRRRGGISLTSCSFIITTSWSRRVLE